MGDRAAQIAAIQTFIADNPDERTAIKQEIDQLFRQVTAPDNGTDLARIMETLSISRSAKLRKYERKDNFARFCERFAEYCDLTNMDPGKQYSFFLQNVDDKTYSILKSVDVSTQQKVDKDQFCILFKRAIYGDELLALKNELRDCKQKSDEKIADYVYRLREKARIAYPDPEESDENCLLAFIRGVRDNRIRRKLNESTVTNFNAATKLAKKLEKVDKMFEKEQSDYTQVLSQKVNFDEENSKISDQMNSKQWNSIDKNSNFGDNSEKRSSTRDKSRNRSDSCGESRSRNRSRDRQYHDRSRQRDGSSRSRERSRDRYRPRTTRSYTPFPRSYSRDRDRYRSQSGERQSRNSSASSRDRRSGGHFSRDRSKRSYSRERYPPWRARTPDKGVTCYACGEFGHIATYCPKSRPPDKGVTCYNCGRYGHYAPDCPNSRYYVDKDRVKCCDKADNATTTGNSVKENDKNFL